MAATVERGAGREAGVASVCDPALLVREYNRIAALRNERGTLPRLPLWSDKLLRLLIQD